MTNNPPIICVFGSSQPAEGTADYENARAVGHALAERGCVVATGGYRGIMEGVSRGAKDAGGRTVGVITEFFMGIRLEPNAWVDEEITMPDYTSRLMKLMEIGDGYIVMPGGSGTLSEMFLCWELMKNGSLPLRPLVLFGASYRRVFDVLLEEFAAEKAFAKCMHLIGFTDDPVEAALMAGGNPAP